MSIYGLEGSQSHNELFPVLHCLHNQAAIEAWIELRPCHCAAKRRGMLDNVQPEIEDCRVDIEGPGLSVHNIHGFEVHGLDGHGQNFVAWK